MQWNLWMFKIHVYAMCWWIVKCWWIFMKIIPFEAIDPKISLELIFFTWIIMTFWSLTQSFLSFFIIWNIKYCFASFETSFKWDIMNRTHCVLVLHACHFPMFWSGHIYNGLYMNLDCRFLKFQLLSLFLCSSWPLWSLGIWTTIGYYWLQALFTPNTP